MKNCSLVPSLSARQIFIAYSMKNRYTVSDKNLTRGKAGYEATDIVHVSPSGNESERGAQAAARRGESIVSHDMIT